MAANRDGVVVGRVSIKVVPATRGFSAKTKKELQQQRELTWSGVHVLPDFDLFRERAKALLESQRKLEWDGINAKIAGLDTKTIQRAVRKLKPVDVPFRFEAEQVKAGLNEVEQRMRELANVSVIDDKDVRDKLNRIYRIHSSIREHLDVPSELLREQDYRRVMARLESVKDEIEEIAQHRTVRLDVNPFTAWAKARLELLSRPRIAEIIPVVSAAGATKAERTLAMLSGARLGHDYLKRFTNYLSDIDKKLPQITLGMVGLTTLISGAGGLIAGVAGLGDSLYRMTPALLLLPGMAANAALSIGTLAVALKDTKTQLGDLADDFKNLGETISTNFWAEARQPLLDLFTRIMPQLEKAMGESARAQGGFIAVFTRAFEQQLGNGRLEAMFAGLTGFWHELSRGADEFARAVTNLGLVSSRYMPRFGRWLADLSIKFDKWLADVAADGRLDGWIENAISQFKYLGRATLAFGGVWQGVWSAASAAGYRGLEGMAKHLEAWERAVKGSKWQETLTAAFGGSKRSLDAFGDSFRNLGDLAHKSRHAIERALGGIGERVASLVNRIITEFTKDDRFVDGFSKLTEGIISGLRSLESAAPAFTRIVANLMATIGGLVERIAPVIAAAMQAVEPVISAALVAMTAFADVLAPVLTGALQAATPLLEAFAPAIVAVGVALGASLVVAKVKALVTVLKELPGAAKAAAAMSAVSGTVQALAAGVPGATAALGSLKTALHGLKAAAGWIGLLATAIGSLFVAMNSKLDKAKLSITELHNTIDSGGNAWKQFQDNIENSATKVSRYGGKFSDLKTGIKEVFETMNQFGDSSLWAWQTRLYDGAAGARQLAQWQEYGRAISEVASRDLPKAQAEFRKFAETANLTSAEMATAIRQSPELKDRLTELASEMGVAADEGNLLKIATGELGQAHLDAARRAKEDARAAEEYATSLEGVNGVAKVLNGELEKAAGQLGNYGSRQQQAREATRHFEDALRTANESLGAYGAGFDQNTEAGRHNLEIIEQLTQAANREAEASLLAGEEHSKVAQRYEERRLGILKLIGDMGREGEAAQALIKELNLMPEDVKTYFDMITGDATTRVDALKGKVQEVPPNNLLRFNAEVDPALSSIANVKQEFTNYEQLTPTAKVKADVAEAQAAVDAFTGKSVDLKVQLHGVDDQINRAKRLMDNLSDKTIRITITGGATQQAQTIETAVKQIRDKTVNVSVNHSAAVINARTVDGIVQGLRDKQVRVTADVSNVLAGAGLVADKVRQIPDKTVRVDVDVWRGVSALGVLRGALDSIRSKTVRVDTHLVTHERTVRRANGGTIPGFASGGTIHGVGGGVYGGTVRGVGSTKSDSILVRLSRGEEVIQEPYASRFRRELKLMNKGILPGFASGGTVGGSKSSGFPSQVILRVGEREFNAYVEERAADVVDERLAPVSANSLRELEGV